MKVLLALAVLALPISTWAGSASRGTIHTIHFFSSGEMLVYSTGSRSGVPACAASFSSRFALNAATPGGKVLAAGLLAAWTAGKSVVIVGNGTCDVYGDSESISYFYIAN